ncbi:MAG: 2-oxo acid dehydrogenase subunit E2 [Promethearchaeota archaeon]
MGNSNSGSDIGTFQIKPISRMAQTIDDYTSESKKKNLIWATTEMDISEVRPHFDLYKAKTGHSLSFTSFCIACFSRVVEQHKFPMNSLRKGRKKMYIFDSVDCMTNIERDMPDGGKKPVNYTVRNAAQKTLWEIHSELRAAQKVREVKLSSGGKKGNKLIKNFPKFPRFVRRLIIRKVFSTPLMKKDLMGTVGVTAVAMNAPRAGNGFMMHITPHTVSMGVGGIGKRPIIVEGKAVEREFLSVTLAMDHALVDGGPATRFFYDLYKLIQWECIEKDWCFRSIPTDLSPPSK